MWDSVNIRFSLIFDYKACKPQHIYTINVHLIIVLHSRAQWCKNKQSVE